jgi:predicted transcriptional regulator
MNQFQKVVQQKQQLYSEYARAINCLLGLTPKQVAVFSKLLELTDSTPFNKKLLNRENRLEIFETCGIDDCNLSTFLTKFKDKGVLVKVKDSWVVNKSLTPIIDDDVCKLVFTIKL